MDKIFIKQLLVPVIIGINEEERRITQTIAIDFEANISTERSANTDDIQDTLNYAEIYQIIQQYVQKTQYFLLERLADKLAQHLFEHFSLLWLRLSISKKPHDLSQAQAVGIVIERQR